MTWLMLKYIFMMAEKIGHDEEICVVDPIRDNAFSEAMEAFDVPIFRTRGLGH